MATLFTPTVNLNGTDKAELLKQYMEIDDKLADAIEALAVAMPHGRDYPDGGLVGARFAWRERLTILRDLRAELMDNAVKISEQGR